MNQVARIQEAPVSELETYEPVISLTEPMAVGLARAEIDVQIATARKFPRSIARASENILTLVTMDEETAGECMYALPRGGKPIKGPSIRLAEIIFQCWGNARCDARIIHVDRVEKVVVAEGVYHDLETNSAGRATVRRSIVGRNKQIFSDDMITVTGNAACSIAKRNAILAGVPKSVWNRAYKAAEGVIAGDIKTLSVSREKAIKAFAAFGVKPEQIFPAIGVEGLEDIGLEEIPVLRGMFTALKSGESTVEEMFNPRKTPSTHEKVTNPLSDKEPEHDPETGEIKEAAPAGEAKPSADADAEKGGVPATGETGQVTQEPAQDAGDKEVSAEAAEDSPEKAALLEQLRVKARKGVPALNRAIVGLSKEQHALLGQGDLDTLRDVAEAAVAAEKGAADA